MGDPFRSMVITVRSSVDPSSLVSAVRRELQALDPSIPLYQVQTMEDVLSADTATERFSMTLQLVFAAVALSLSAVGLYGVLSFAVTRRTAEIGIRIALGAQQSGVRRMVIRQGLTIALLALALGVAGAFASARLLEGLLFGVTARDPLTYVAVVAVLLLVALIACWIPARRASTVDPVVALRAS
jgi:ABC-type antimicrobial peptide transport system permease subunit